MKLVLDLPPDPTPHQIMAAVAMADPHPYRRWEVIGDALRAQPSPVNPHSDVQAEIVETVRRAYKRRISDPDDGWVILIVPDLKDIPDRDGIKRPKVPDLGGWRAKRYILNDAQYCSTAPDWVCEILSPSTAELDRGPKAKDYAKLGVEWYWLIDLKQVRLDVWRLSEGEYTQHAVHSLRSNFAADPFQQAVFDADDFAIILERRS